MDTMEAMDVDVSSKNEVDNIQIFTKEFLQHNKQRENELRNLKATVNDYEMKNAALEKEISSISSTINGLDAEIGQKKSSNALLYNHLSKIRSQLYKEFQGVPNPETGELPSQDNIEGYLVNLQKSYSSNKVNNPKEKERIKQKIASVLSKCPEVEKADS